MQTDINNTIVIDQKTSKIYNFFVLQTIFLNKFVGTVFYVKNFITRNQ